jgi:hypothetical protein
LKDYEWVYIHNKQIILIYKIKEKSKTKTGLTRQMTLEETFV